MATQPCPHCGREHSAQAQFCSVTGKPIATPPATEPPVATPPPASRLSAGPSRMGCVFLLLSLGLFGIVLVAAGGAFLFLNNDGGLELPVAFRPATATRMARSTREPTATPIPPTATPTFTPSSTTTLTPTPSPSATPSLSATPFPSPTRTLTPVPVSTACAIQPTGAFASLWLSKQSELGCPRYAAPKIISDAEELFQNGHMFWRADVDVYYVIYDGGGAVQGGWVQYGSKYNAGGQSKCTEAAPANLVKPASGFGDVWCALGGANALIGWAVDKEYGFGAGQGRIRVQDFQSGVIFQDSDGMSRGLVYVLFATGRFVRVAP